MGGSSSGPRFPSTVKGIPMIVKCVRRVELLAVYIILLPVLAWASTGNVPPKRILYNFTSIGQLRGSPSIGADGTIYQIAGSALCAITPNGTLKWKLDNAGNGGTPVVGNNGNIYAYDGITLRSISADGIVEWTYDDNSWGDVGGIAIGPDGTIYLSAGNLLDAINPNGTLRWSYDLYNNLGAEVDVPATIGTVGTIYVCTTDGGVLAFDPAGNLSHSDWGWECTDSPAIWGSKGPLENENSPQQAAIGSDGTIYETRGGGGGEGFYLYASKADWTRKWTFFSLGSGAAEAMPSPPAIGSDGTIYTVAVYLDENWVPTGWGEIFAVNPDGTLKWHDLEWGLGGSPVIINGGILYVRSQYYLYAYSIGGTPANSPWPMFQHDAEHSGAARIFVDIGETSDWAYPFISDIYTAGLTGGCSTSPLEYCPDMPVTRAEMSVFLERGKNGGSYVPPAATGIFGDVPISPTKYWAADWIEQLYNDGMTGGCAVSPLEYCPERDVTRAEMAVFLLRAEHGRYYTPPPAQGIFTDVPVDYWAAAWIEQLYAEGITDGCATSPLDYCPDRSVTRAEMAVFLDRIFLQ